MREIKYKYKSITLNGRKHYADIWKAVKEARRKSREYGESLNDIDGLTVNAIHLYDDQHFYYYVTSGEDWDGGVVNDSEEDARLVFGPGITKNREKIIEKIEDMGQSCPVYLADDGRGDLIEIDSFDDVENWAREEFRDEKCLYRPTEQLENGIVWERWVRGGSCEWIFRGRTLLDRSASKMDVIEEFIEIPEDLSIISDLKGDLATLSAELSEIEDKIEQGSEEYGLKIDRDKLKGMIMEVEDQIIRAEHPEDFPE